MALTITSTNAGVQNYIDQTMGDEDVTLDEFEALSKAADRRAGNLDYPALTDTMAAFQKAADDLAEATKALASAARRGEITGYKLDAVMGVVEFQLAYVVAGYETYFEHEEPMP
ncbi:hypothetical protein FHW69_003638 [Luteibacter sp. Sphag1AF]|uniref:hypothetical protein n=1 Tax=Luteibacter sp. Sphag1AF TaxID=2587031 RepID=UPI001610AE26|nr:hypothetical protein [Luteibacter sp. Sphag1AF]MBB3228990.1 hypothetical protein [Luteibacter sp. Sphag1AF]